MFAAKKLQGAAGAGGGPTWDLDYAYYDDPNAGDLSTAAYTLKSFSVASQDTFPMSVTFSPDGTRMYVGGYTGQDVNQYTLSTAWDVTTASYVTNFSISATAVRPIGLWFKPDGTKFYVTSSDNDRIYQYSCSTAWSLATASYDSVSFSVSSQDTQPQSLQFSPDGTKFYILGVGNKTIYQYTLSTAWDLSTASYASKSYGLTSAFFDRSAACFGLSGDGTKLYALEDYTTDTLFQYDLSTAWDISTASYASKSFVTSAQETGPYGMFVRPDGGGFYITGSDFDTVYQYVMGGFSVAAQDGLPYNVSFKPDGTSMYITGATNDTIYQYTLSTAWDMSTASYASKNKSVASQDTNPRGIFFKPDGTKMFMVGYENDKVYRYALSTAWDVSTASFETGQEFSVAAQAATPIGLVFKPDGTTMYMSGATNDTVYQYTLSTAWDLTTASYASKSLSVSSKETTPIAIALKDDGTVLFVSGSASDSVHEYSLSTAWDVSTGSFSKSLFSGGGSISGMFFKPDGSKFFLSDYASDLVYTYSIGNQ